MGRIEVIAASQFNSAVLQVLLSSDVTGLVRHVCPAGSPDPVEEIAGATGQPGPTEDFSKVISDCHLTDAPGEKQLPVLRLRPDQELNSIGM